VDTLLTILAIHALVLGLAFTGAGFLSLVAPSETEVEARRRAYEAERAKGWWRGLLFSARQARVGRYEALAQVPSHWLERPQSRRFLYIGLAALACAAIIGYHLGLGEYLNA
jgi:hypothetical protein